MKTNYSLVRFVHWQRQQAQDNRATLTITACILAYPIVLLLGKYWFGIRFFAITADDFARALLGWKVTQGTLIPSDVWPPLQFWLVALGLSLYPHIVWVPLLINLGAATAALLGMAQYTKLIGLRLPGQVFALVFAASTPWFLWLSLSGLAEPLYICCVIWAFVGVAQWRRYGRQAGLWLAAACLLAAGMLRFDAWAFSGVFSLMVGWLWLRTPLPRPFSWLLAASVPWLFPLWWLSYQYVRHGDLLWFVNVVRDYAFILQGRQPLLTRISWQIIDLWRAAGLVLPLGVLGLFLLRKTASLGLSTAMLAGSFCFLVYTTITGVISVANPARLVAIHAFLLAPAAGASLQWLSDRRWRWDFAAITLFVVGLVALRAATLPAYPNGIPQDTAQVGAYLQEWRAKEPLSASRQIMIEVLFWDYVMLPVFSDAPEHTLYDRSPVLVLRSNGRHELDDVRNPSAFAQQPAQLRATLAKQNVALVIVYSQRAVSNVQPIAHEVFAAGRYHVFALEPAQ